MSICIGFHPHIWIQNITVLALREELTIPFSIELMLFWYVGDDNWFGIDRLINTTFSPKR
jgi:hypothetical protein